MGGGEVGVSGMGREFGEFGVVGLGVLVEEN